MKGKQWAGLRVRLGIAAVSAVLLVTPGVEAQDDVKVKRRTLQGAQVVDLSAAQPLSPNPYVSYLPEGVEPDWAYWNAWLADRGQKRAAALSPPSKILNVSETESNDTRATANPLGGFGSGSGDDPAADLSGTFPAPPAPTDIGPFAEDDGDIPAASATGITSGARVRASATIGDGPYGSGGTGSGDFDFFALPGLTGGDILSVDIDTFIFSLDSFVTLWDSTGEIVAFNDDEILGVIFDSLLQVTIPADGTYYVSVGSFSSPIPLDPFDSSSGFGVGEEGPYTVTFGLNAGDLDYYAIDLEAGDVVGANLSGSGTLASILDATGQELIGSGQDLAGLYPLVSPLPAGGNASLACIIPTTGTYYFRASGVTGTYSAQLRVFRPALENAGPEQEQILYIDFDGGVVPRSIFGGSGLASLSPLSEFLSRWGLTGADENAVIDAILAATEENLDADMQALGLNPAFGIELRNSRDHVDPFGQPNVSRIVVGGTTAQLNIVTIGIAESIDVGNFETEETAVVLLDLLSEVPSDPNSLSSFPRHPSATIIDVIGIGVGNIVAHEAGHYFGSFHTEQFFTDAFIMDQGGNLGGLLGIGLDGIFGSADDLDVDFGTDIYVPSEGFTGLEDTLNTTAFGLFSSVTPEAPDVRISSAPALGFIEETAPLVLRAPAGAMAPFQWQRNVGMGLEAVVDDSRITGSDTGELRFAPVLASDTGVYFVSYDDGTKVIVTSSPFNLTMLPPGALPAAGVAALAMLGASIAAAGVVRTLRRRT